MYTPEEISQMVVEQQLADKAEQQKKNSKIGAESVKCWLAGQNVNLSGKDLIPKKK